MFQALGLLISLKDLCSFLWIFHFCSFFPCFCFPSFFFLSKIYLSFQKGSSETLSMRQLWCLFCGKCSCFILDFRSNLVGGNSNIFWNFHPENWGRWTHFWLIFFKWVETANQLILGQIHVTDSEIVFFTNILLKATIHDAILSREDLGSCVSNIPQTVF